jgi:hypothetical protein
MGFLPFAVLLLPADIRALTAVVTHLPFPEPRASIIFTEGATVPKESIGQGAAAQGDSPRLLGCVPAGNPCHDLAGHSRYCLGIFLFRVFGQPVIRRLERRSRYSPFRGCAATASGTDPLMGFACPPASCTSAPIRVRRSIELPADPHPRLRFRAVYDG